MSQTRDTHQPATLISLLLTVVLSAAAAWFACRQDMAAGWQQLMAVLVALLIGYGVFSSLRNAGWVSGERRRQYTLGAFYGAMLVGIVTVVWGLIGPDDSAPIGLLPLFNPADTAVVITLVMAVMTMRMASAFFAGHVVSLPIFRYAFSALIGLSIAKRTMTYLQNSLDTGGLLSMVLSAVAFIVLSYCSYTLIETFVGGRAN